MQQPRVLRKIEVCSANSVIVFGGYPKDIVRCSTKRPGRWRRGQASSVEIKFHESMVPVTSRANFLKNGKNKSRLIQRLMKRFRAETMSVFQAEEVTDTIK